MFKVLIPYFFPIILFIIAVLISIFKPKIKGFIGEKTTSTILSFLDSEKYKIINDVMIKTENGYSQIDHIVVSIYGIFVIETKNYKGWITGKEFSDTWTKNVYGNKYSFKNPLLQNYGHVKTLENVLNLKNEDFIPIVVFSTDSDIRVKTSKPVVYSVNLKKEIEHYTDEKFSALQVNDLTEKIKSINVVSKEIRKEHISNIHHQIKSDNDKINNNVCPKCGGNLIIRKGKYGDFYGCDNYPKCKFTKNI